MSGGAWDPHLRHSQGVAGGAAGRRVDVSAAAGHSTDVYGGVEHTSGVCGGVEHKEDVCGGVKEQSVAALANLWLDWTTEEWNKN